LSVKIRLKRMGSKKNPFYRFVATDSRNARDGRFIETLGYYNPMTDPPDLKIKEEAVIKWMQRGAQPTANTESLLKKMGFMKKWQLIKQGLTGDALESKLNEIKAASTPAKSPQERAKEEEAKKAEAARIEAKAKADAEAKEAEAKAEAEAAQKQAEAPAEEAATDAPAAGETATE
jgi:small subunit ribosomal protein S16